MQILAQAHVRSVACTYTYSYTYICMYAYIYMCVYICIFVMYVRMFSYIFISTYWHKCTRVRHPRCTHTYTCVHTRTHIFMHVHIPIYIYTHIFTSRHWHKCTRVRHQRHWLSHAKMEGSTTRLLSSWLPSRCVCIFVQVYIYVFVFLCIDIFPPRTPQWRALQQGCSVRGFSPDAYAYLHKLIIV